MLTLTLKLWQNDIFLILMWIIFTIYRIIQLILRNRSYWKCPLCRIMTGASYMFCLGRLSNVLHSRFGFRFALTFLYLPVIHIHISFSQCLTLNPAAGYNSSCLHNKVFFLKHANHAQVSAVMGTFVFSWYKCLFFICV